MRPGIDIPTSIDDGKVMPGRTERYVSKSGVVDSSDFQKATSSKIAPAIARPRGARKLLVVTCMSILFFR